MMNTIENFNESEVKMRPTGTGLLIALLFYFGNTIIIGIILVALGRENDSYTNLMAMLYGGVITILFFAIYERFYLGNILKGFLNKKIYIYSIIAMLSVYVFSIIYNITLENFAKDIIGDSVGANENAVREMANSVGIVYSIIAIAIVIPIVEEIVFRYYLFTYIRRINVPLGFIVSVIIFAGVHLISSVSEGTLHSDILFLPSYLAPSLAFTLVYHKTNNIAAPIVLHILNNLISVLLLFLLLSN